MIRSVKSLALLLLALAGGLALADDDSLRRYELPNLDTLELALPAGWQDETDVPPGGIPLTIRLYPVASNIKIQMFQFPKRKSVNLVFREFEIVSNFGFRASDLELIAALSTPQ